MTVRMNETAEQRAKRLKRNHEYDLRPENKARRRERQQTPEWKARARAYQAELKARQPPTQNSRAAERDANHLGGACFRLGVWDGCPPN
jgi:hypothetical protein